MATILNTNGTALHIPEIDDKVAGKFYVVTAEWNQDITHALRDGALGTLRGSCKDDGQNRNHRRRLHFPHNGLYPGRKPGHSRDHGYG